ncbi:lytic polysaccharide monooxygenase [Phytohabitans houttuyneae]|uniref:Cellulose-binding protein n=1 Tax=Phytohabitans houttuyneae TaxID=1076126 RepID=A0A6V8KRF4_9ACTN|nr:lytic polysaccharide monooxygenase [Phytohabitans houttuyneae]GFJ84416.1 cellulose-binding protein [Phytohabitans houttuyneae]
MNLRRKVAAFAGGIAALPLVLIALPSSPASGHGWITSPPSRQDMCATGRVANCGPIQYEPQSVEGPKGLRSCNGGLAQFAVLNDSSRFPATSTGSTVTFNWRLTAAHRTTTWEYWVGSRLLASFSQNNQQPPFSLSHTVSGIPSGRQTVLAIWNIADTPMAFYACVDLQVGGGGTNPTTPPPNPTTPPPNPTTPPPSQGGTWAAGTAYAVGARVTYGGRTYQCLQAHTALAGWEPPNVPALWRAV